MQNYKCPHCGLLQEKPNRPAIGTKVTHADYGKGTIFSYDQCDDFTCGVDFGKNGQWCLFLKDLEIAYPHRGATDTRNLKQNRP